MPRRWRQVGAAVRWTACLWPGLPQLWRGSWRGLAAAVLFAWLACWLVVTTCVWTEWVVPDWRNATAAFVVGFWVVGVAVSCRQWWRAASRKNDEISTPPTADLFSAAVTEYLRNNLLAAERHLLAVARGDRHSGECDDVPTHLLLAAVWRRMGRRAEARGMLNQLSTWDKAAPWRTEIERELARLSERASPPAQAGAASAPVACTRPAADDAAMSEHLDPAA